MSQSESAPQLYGIAEIAAIMNVSMRAVNKWVDSRRLRVSVPGIADDRQVSERDLIDFAIGFLGISETEMSNRIGARGMLDDSLMADPTVRDCIQRGGSLGDVIRALVSEKQCILRKLNDLASDSGVNCIGTEPMCAL